MTTVTEKIEFNRWYVAIGAGLLVLALLLQPDWLGRLRPDGSLNTVDTLADFLSHLPGAARTDRAVLALLG